MSSSSVTRKAFPFHEFEPSWQRYWAENRSFRAPNPEDADFDRSKPKFYALDMFPYPSGDGLHVGHPEGYTATDIVSRYKRKLGFNVLHPMGWDAFGLPAEQYAIKTGQHPRVTTAKNVARFRAQLQRLGFAYDWDREVNTTDPGYFKWTQWIFLQLYQSWFNPETKRAEPIATCGLDDADSVRLAYVADVPVWWCEGLGTVLANEEVVDGRSEVGGFPVERRPMRQWMLRITAFADRLLDELEPLDWSESIKDRQRDWIGRSVGAEVRFQIAGAAGAGSAPLTVFTTRPDTLFGATYMVLAPEHPLVESITTPDQRGDVEAYRKATAARSELERGVGREKSGVPTGAFAINPVNDQRIPIWIADYVLMGYGTGAIMAVPGHDTRDFEFATTFGLPVIEVVRSDSPAGEAGVFTGDGVAVNSPLIDGLRTPEAKTRIIRWLEERGHGRAAVHYKLRDWLFARQRYWGEPFPIIWDGGRHRAVPETELPVVPPELDDFKPTGTIDPPLAKAKDWVRYSESATRELNTMPQWAGSCWYYLRFCDPHNRSRFVGREAEAYWSGSDPSPVAGEVGSESVSAQRPGHGAVDLYVGGTEHAVLHLLYSRFWHKVLFDLGHLSTPEPFQKLVNQGLILGEDGQKMSKSRGNVINPDHVVDEYGADALRLFEMFMGPLEAVKPWSTHGVEGVYRFLARVWRLVMEEDQEGRWQISARLAPVAMSKNQLKVLHATIRKVTHDCEALSFNTAISQMMVCTNEFTAADPRPLEGIVTLLHLLNPFAPHLAEELNARLRERFPTLPDGLLGDQPWPAFEERHLVEDELEIVVQVNGKLRDRVHVPATAPNEVAEQAALASARVQEHIAGKTVRKVIVVPGKLVNVVAN